jgi:hypothetical protein
MNQPLIICAWHPLYHLGETLIMQEGDASQRSDGCCSKCEAAMMREIQMRKVQR